MEHNREKKEERKEETVFKKYSVIYLYVVEKI